MKNEKIRNAIYGALIGDAYGVPYEFMKPHEIENVSFTSDVIRGPHLVPDGTYSDDGSQILLLFNAIINRLPFGEELRKWFYRDKFWIDERFDCGMQTSIAITEGTENLNNKKCNGNGSLMRTLPVGLLFSDPVTVIRQSSIYSAFTHPHIMSRTCCAFYSLIIMFLMQMEKPDLTLAIADASKFVEIDSYPSIAGSGYVLDSLWSAIHCVSESSSYEDAIIRAIRLGNDTDTTACIAGGIAGMIYPIPQHLIDNLRGKEIIEGVLADFEKKCNVTSPIV